MTDLLTDIEPETTPTPGIGHRPMVRQALHTMVLRILTLLCRLCLLFMAGRTLAPADYGIYALITTMTTFGTVVGGLNLYTYLYRAVPGQPPGKQLNLFKSTFAFETAMSALLVTVIIVSGGLPTLTRWFNAQGHETAFLLGLIQIVLLLATIEANHFLCAQARIEAANWIDFLSQGSWVLALTVAWIASGRIALEWILIGQIAGSASAIVYTAWQVGLRRWWNATIDLPGLRTGLAYSLPMIIPAVSVYSLKLADRPILSHYASLSDVGVYSFAYTFLNTLYSFTAWVGFNTLNPRIYAAHNIKDYATRDVLQTYLLKASLVGFVLPSLVLFVLARPIVSLVARPDYLPAAAVMPMIALSFVMIIVAYPAHSLLMLQDRVVTLAAIDVVGMFIGVGGNFLLIPRWGYWGAATASVAGLGAAAVLKYACSGMRKSLRPDLMFSLRPESDIVRTYFRRLLRAEA